MRIAIYGLPCAGKTYLLERIAVLPTYHGSALLLDINPEFHRSSEAVKEQARRQLASRLSRQDDFVMDGHYAFGDQVVFTEADGELYDAFLYLYVDPDILRGRMLGSSKNSKYANFDIAKWQHSEISGLRSYCQEHAKDFYVLDDPENGYLKDVSSALEFISRVVNGFSVQAFATGCAERILVSSLGSDFVHLIDGDGTLTYVDTCCTLFEYKTNIFDGNFYTGYQSWLNHKALSATFAGMSPDLSQFVRSLELRKSVLSLAKPPAFILTTGWGPLWRLVAEDLSWGCFHGEMMCADAKQQIAKRLRSSGKTVYAFGDSINDVYMLREADMAYLVHKASGELSRSLSGVDLEGFHHVCS